MSIARSVFHRTLRSLQSVRSVRSVRSVAYFGGRRPFSTSTGSADEPFDVCVVGGGIVGLSTARELLLRYPQLRLIVVERESTLAPHQSSHNSGVIHAGIYYAPGTLRAKLCVKGSKLLYEYCAANNIKTNRCGKLIVAVSEDEIPRLNTYYERSVQNEVPGVELLTAKQITEREPRIVGVKGLWSPTTGIVDFKAVAESYARDILRSGAAAAASAGGGGSAIRTGFGVTRMQRDSNQHVAIESSSGQSIKARHVITCGGCWSDRLAQLNGGAAKPMIVPFRGTWFKLTPNVTNWVSTNIYPVANPNFPFLGVHGTPTVNGEVLLGPNACLALSRSGYRWSDVDMRDAAEIVQNPALVKMIGRNIGFAIGELLNEVMPSRTLKYLQRYMPSLRAEHLQPTTVSGVRAQALSDDGGLVDDFVFEQPSTNVLNVRNAPSPGATSSLAIASIIADTAQRMFLTAALIPPSKLNASH